MTLSSRQTENLKETQSLLLDAVSLGRVAEHQMAALLEIGTDHPEQVRKLIEATPAGTFADLDGAGLQAAYERGDGAVQLIDNSFYPSDPTSVDLDRRVRAHLAERGKTHAFGGSRSGTPDDDEYTADDYRSALDAIRARRTDSEIADNPGTPYSVHPDVPYNYGGPDAASRARLHAQAMAILTEKGIKDPTYADYAAALQQARREVNKEQPATPVPDARVG